MNRVRAGLLFSAALIAVAVVASCGSTPPSRLEFVGITPNPPRLGDTTTVTFKATDSRGLPLEGAPIRFHLETPGGVPEASPDGGAAEFPGVTLSPREAQTLEDSGEVHVTLVANTRVSTVIVVATSADGSVVARSLPISFAGTTSSASRLTFQCGTVAGAASGGVHAINAYDHARHLTAGIKLECFAHVADRNGDGVPGAQVSFLAEAGHIDPTATTEADVIGNARVLYKTALPLPLDVDPEGFSWTVNNDETHTGQFRVPLWMQPWRWKANPVADYELASVVCVTEADCPEPRRPDPLRPAAPDPLARVLNPRDNLVTLIAVTRGEEGFTDSNNNGVFDEGEPFDDLTEPFVDMNDNGTRDDFEPFIDANDDGEWNGKNLQFDSSTLIWVEEKILWTGLPGDGDFTGPNAVVRMVTPQPIPTIQHFESVRVRMVVSDPWFNSMARNASSDGCSLVSSQTVMSTPEVFDQGSRMTYPAAELLSFLVSDAHDPSADPVPPAYTSPVNWQSSVICRFTSSPIDGHEVSIDLGGPSGSVL